MPRIPINLSRYTVNIACGSARHLAVDIRLLPAIRPGVKVSGIRAHEVRQVISTFVIMVCPYEIAACVIQLFGLHGLRIAPVFGKEFV